MSDLFGNHIVGFPTRQLNFLLHLQEFLDLGGVDSLLDSLDQMAGRGFTCFSDAILQIDCISCIRCILNTGIGLEYFVSNDVYTKKLTMGNVPHLNVNIMMIHIQLNMLETQH